MRKVRYILLSIATLLAFMCTHGAAQMRVHMIDVGQAEAILLEFQFYAVLIDVGSEDTGDDRYSKRLHDYLVRFFNSRPDLKQTIHSIIVTHPHRDHTSELVPILQAFRVRNLIDGGETTGSGVAQLREARKLARGKNIVYNKITEKLIGDSGYTPSYLNVISSLDSSLRIRFLSGNRGCENENNNSLVLLVNYGKASMIFLGDAQIGEDKRCGESQVNHLISKYKGTGLLNVDVMKVSHHGSRAGTSSELLEQTTPRISLISAGHPDVRSPGPFHAWQFGNPRTSTIEMLASFTTAKRLQTTVTTMNSVKNAEDYELTQAIYCTCWDGNIVLSVNPSEAVYSVQIE